jgi:hypothetical protein
LWSAQEKERKREIIFSLENPSHQLKKEVENVEISPK